MAGNDNGRLGVREHIAYRPGSVVSTHTAGIWRDGYKAAMTRVETCLLSGDIDWLSREVAAALAENRGRPPKDAKRRVER